MIEGRLEAGSCGIMTILKYGFAPALFAAIQGVSQSYDGGSTMTTLPPHAQMSNTPSTPGIYAIVNTQNNDAYIGSTVNLSRREGDHFRALRKGTHKNRHLQSAYNLYGADSFVFYIVELVEEKTDLVTREQHYIDTLSPEYNLSPTAGNTLGTKYSEEARQRLSVARRKWTLSPESIALGASKRVGYKHSKEFGEAISARQKGRTFTEETRTKMSVARKGKPRPAEEVRKSAEARRGLKKSPESIEKTAEWHRGKRRSDEVRARMSNAQKNSQYVPSDETREKLSRAGMGRVPTEEARKNMSNAQKKNKAHISEETRIKMSIAAKKRRERERNEK